MAIPAFDNVGVIPPFGGGDPTVLDRSPYFATMTELVLSLGTTNARRQLIKGLISYRRMLREAGYESGLQFIDGSFVENVEMSQKRAPGDIDVFSFLSIPSKFIERPDLWASEGRLFWLSEVINQPLNKNRYALDTYAVLSEELGLIGLIQSTVYWYGLFSHQKETFRWKGFVAIALDSLEDQKASEMIGGGV